MRARLSEAPTVIPFLKPPRAAILYLKDPRERFWGLVHALDDAGIVMQGVDLDSFDSWLRQVAEGGEAPSPATVFFPLLRVEKLMVDVASGSIPSLHDLFVRRMGRPLSEFLGLES